MKKRLPSAPAASTPASATPGVLTRARPTPLALEQRLVFDGDVAKCAGEAAFDGNALLAAAEAAPVAELPSFTEPAIEAARGSAVSAEIAFVDTSVADWQSLVANIRPGVEVVLLDPAKDGLDQIRDAVQGRANLDAIHIISHGSTGTLILGSSQYNAENIATRAETLAAIGASLTDTGDVLLYGCDIGGQDSGATLLGRLAYHTGGDVAASTDTTGTARVGGNWTLEQNTGEIEARLFLTDEGAARYDHWLNTVALNGRTGWTPVMFGPTQDPQGDSQAGAADTDIVGDASHGSLYTAFDNRGTGSTADDLLLFRLRIDNPTNSSPPNFNGVAIVGIDANGDGRIDLFVSVDGRNNTRAVRLMDPGTGANLSPSTTTTSPLPTGWLANNGVYPFAPGNYSVVAVSAATDSDWNGNADLGGDGNTDIFVSWAIPISDLATVLAKASPVDRNGVYGPRGTTGIAGFDQNTVVRYVSFTQTQPGPINGDLNGVGRNYDRNATFAELGAFTAPMSATDPVAAGPRVTINQPISDGVINDAENDAVTISGTSANVANRQLTLAITDGATTVTATTITGGDGSWSLSGLNLSGLNDGTLTVTATVDPDGNPGTNNNVVASATVLHDKTPPVITIDQLATTTSGRPTFTGTSDLPDGALITVTIDPDNNPATANLLYQVAVSGGIWTLNTASVAPVSGTMPSSGLTAHTKVTATATDAAGNSATATALNRPTVNTLLTNSTTPVITGTWTRVTGDGLTVTISGATYTLAPSGNTWSLNLATATPTSGSLTPLVPGQSYEVTVTVTRDSAHVSDTSSAELTITSAPVKEIDISGGSTVGGTDTTPVISGTSANAGGFVIVRLDPGNDGDLSDAVTYSVPTDGSGNWTLNTGSATPISGTVPSVGFIGAVGVYATDSTGAVSDTQVLTITTPTVTISQIASTATTNSAAVVNNSGAAGNWLNMTEDDAVTISGTATDGFTIDLVVSDANGNSVTRTGLTVTGGSWSATGVDLSGLDNTTLTVRATLSGTTLSATNTTVTHDTTAPRIFITTPSEIKKNGGVIYGGSELPNTTLNVVVRNEADTADVWTGTVTTDAQGKWTVTTSGNLVSGANGNVIIRVSAPANTADAAGNLVQTAQKTQYVAANASLNSIAIATIAGDNLITADEVSGGVTISGTTTLTGSGNVSVAVTDGTTTHNLTGTYASGSWSATLTKTLVQTLKNGQLTVTAQAADGTISINAVALPSLSLPTPVLEITDDVAGTASGPVTFTFVFSEGVSGFTADDVVVSGGTKGAFTAISSTEYTLVVTPASNSSGTISVSVPTGAANGLDTGRGSAADATTQAFNTTPAAAAPDLTIDTSSLATESLPVITGTTTLTAGAPIVITISPDNDGSGLITYSAIVQSGGTWSLDLSTATPTAGTLAADGLTPSARITARATNAYGNSTQVVGLNRPTVVEQLTHENTPLITGTWTQLAGDALTVVVNGVTYSVASGNLAVTATGWSLTPTTALADGTYEVAATVSRTGGGTAVDPNTSELKIDTLATVSISGGATVALTGDRSPVISGTSTGLPAGTVLTLGLDLDGNGGADLVYQTSIAADGTWSIDTATAIPISGTFPSSGLDGSVAVTATATDPAGNVGTDTQTLVVDVTPPIIGLTFNTKTSDTTPLITGTTDLPAGSTITVEIDPNNDGNWSDAHTYSATVQAGGVWSVEATTPLSGTVGVRASGADAMSNSTVTPVRPLTIVANAPALHITAPLPTVGSDNVADATEDDAIVILGTAAHLPPGTLVTVTVTDGNFTISDTAEIQNDGTWSLAALNLSSMAVGAITVTATAVDDDGSAYVDITTFVHDKSAIVAIDSISEDTGTLADFITQDDTVSITGTATPNNAVAIVVRHHATNTIVGTFNVTANGAGAWSTAPTSVLAPGEYRLEATVGSTTVTRTMTVLDVTPPLITGPSGGAGAATSAITISENTIAVSTLVANEPVTWSLVGGNDAARFTIHPTTGALTFIVPPDFENPTDSDFNNTYLVQVRATDASGTTSVQTITVTVADVAETVPETTAPVIAAGQVFTYAENRAAGAVLGTVAASDNLGVTGFRFSNGSSTSTDGYFTIAANGAISVTAAGASAATNDFELTPNAFTLGVQARDAAGNWSAVVDVSLQVTDLDETVPDTTAPVIAAGQVVAYAENHAAGAVLGTVAATDDLGVTGFRFANGSTTSTDGYFTIAANGAISLTAAGAAAAANDFELAPNEFTLDVQARDAAGNWSAAAGVTLRVTDLVESIPDTTAPLISGPSGGAGAAQSAITVSENTTAVTTFAANEAVTWSLVTGPDAARFSLDATTGVLTFLHAPDYENPTDHDANNTYIVEIRATDAAGNVATQTLTVTVADLNEAPSAPALSNRSGEIGSPLTPYTVPAFSDPDGTPLTYSATLADGATLPSWLVFNPVTRTFSGTPPAGTIANVLEIRVTASDGTATASATFALSLSLPAAPHAGSDTAQATEAGGIANSVAGSDPSGNVLANDTGARLTVTAMQPGNALTSAASAVTAGSTPTMVAGAYGTLSIGADGSYTYSVNNAHPEVEALNFGDSLVESFHYRVTDAAGQTSIASLQITIRGASDAPPVVVVPQLPVAPVTPSQPVTIPVVVSPPTNPTLVAPTPAAVLAPTTSMVAILPALAPALSNDISVARATLSTSEPGEASSRVGFEITIVPSESPSLVTFRGVPDQFALGGATISFAIPRDAFAHTRPDAQITLTATLLDGAPLPKWLVFDRASGTFRGVPPKGFIGEIRIKVTAHDQRGLQADAVFRFHVGDNTIKPTATKSGLSDQLRRLTYLSPRSSGSGRLSR
jgi:large repetitive protein